MVRVHWCVLTTVGNSFDRQALAFPQRHASHAIESSSDMQRENVHGRPLPGGKGFKHQSVQCHCNAVTHAPPAHYARGDGSNVMCGATQASINDLILLQKLMLQVQMATFSHDVAQACPGLVTMVNEAILRCQREHLPFQIISVSSNYNPNPPSLVARRGISLSQSLV